MQANVLAARPTSAHPGARPALAETDNAEDEDHAIRAAKAFEQRLCSRVPHVMLITSFAAL